MSEQPPRIAVTAAIRAASRSPCKKSKRGVSAFNGSHRTDITGPAAFAGYLYTAACNLPALGNCDGSRRCKETCGLRCVHAEANVLLKLRGPHLTSGGRGHVDLLHVKFTTAGTFDEHGDPNEDWIKPSGAPSCITCSRLIAHDPRVDAIWLYHRHDLPDIEPGWRRWQSDEFHIATMKNEGIS